MASVTFSPPLKTNNIPIKQVPLAPMQNKQNFVPLQPQISH